MKELIIPPKLKKGSRIAVVSLSWGILGEKTMEPFLQLGISRMKALGMEPVFMPNALKGESYILDEPEARAQDLKDAFADPSVDGILCAIGGDDTYRTLPYLMEDEEFRKNVRTHPKVFMGYSDTTVNHFMLYGLGLATYYAPCFLVHYTEQGEDMLSYTKNAVRSLFEGTAPLEVLPSEMWYESKKDFFDFEELPTGHKNHPYELLQGNAPFSGELLGGCLESIYDLLTGARYPDEKQVCEKYHLFPDRDEWAGKILFIETCEEKPTPSEYERNLLLLGELGIFDVINGMIVGKPQDEVYYEEYKEILRRIVPRNVPILYNVNIGHARPITVLPIGRRAICCENRIILP